MQDTLIQIHRAKETDSLKKPLKVGDQSLCHRGPRPSSRPSTSSTQVKFIGEEGVDEGGVAKEFFQLLVRAGTRIT